MHNVLKTFPLSACVYRNGTRHVVSYANLIIILLLCYVGVSHADIDNLAFLGHNEVNRFHLMDVEVVGNRAYVANGLGAGFEAYDISDPNNPQRIYTNGSDSWRIESFGDTLAVSFCRRDGVVLYDISGGIPSALGQYNPPGALEALEGGVVIGNLLYCAAHQNGVYIIDISDPSNPQKIDEFPMIDAAAWNIVAKDSFLFVANGRFGLSIIGVSGGLHETANLALVGCANDINLDDDIAVISLSGDGLATVDILSPHSPTLLDTIATDGCVWGSGLVNHLLISGSWRVMELYDVSNPNNITRASWDNTQTWAMGADIRNDSLVVVADWRGMSCYKVGPDQDSDIDVYPQVIDYGSVSGNKDTTVIVRNTGSAVLNVSSVSAPSGIVPVPNSFTVQPGDSQLVTVTASGSGTVSSFITYNCNDPDELSKAQEVYKNNTGFPQIGSLAPDFNLLGTDGQMHSLTRHRGKVIFLEFGAGW